MQLSMYDMQDGREKTQFDYFSVSEILSARVKCYYAFFCPEMQNAPPSRCAACQLKPVMGSSGLSAA